jgi:hypothetical protein
LANQVKNYVISQADGMGVEAYTQQIVNALVSLNISPFGSVVIMQILNTDIPRLLDCIFLPFSFSIFVAFLCSLFLFSLFLFAFSFFWESLEAYTQKIVNTLGSFNIS